uniref:non-specific serine/threonine protein kinase n=1 Tax=Clandestinovirus TaxID=2831644 RepID=A0A8F8KQC1_9VIRU|nr:serine/threonine protein kinase [Clandestinovirus]
MEYDPYDTVLFDGNPKVQDTELPYDTQLQQISEDDTNQIQEKFDSQYDSNETAVRALDSILQFGMSLNLVRVRGCSPQFAMYALSVFGSGNSESPIASGCLTKETPCTHPIAIKILPRYNVHSDSDPGWVEVSYLKRANEELVSAKHTPHVAAYLASFECQGSILEHADLFFQSPMDKAVFMHMLQSMMKNDVGDTTIFVLLAERASHQSLTQVAKTVHRDYWVEYFRMIIFQVVWTIACFQQKFPGFRHNDIWSSNVLIADTPSTSALYRVSKEEQYMLIPGDSLPSNLSNHTARLWDFEYACSRDQQNDKVDGERNAMINNGNPYYDVHFFLNHLYSLLLKYSDNQIPSDLDAFFKRVIPRKFMGCGANKSNPSASTFVRNYRLTLESQDLARAEGLKTPMEILRDDFFRKYRQTRKPNLSSTDIYTLPQTQ